MGFLDLAPPGVESCRHEAANLLAQIVIPQGPYVEESGDGGPGSGPARERGLDFARNTSAGLDLQNA